MGDGDAKAAEFRGGFLGEDPIDEWGGRGEGLGGDFGFVGEEEVGGVVRKGFGDGVAGEFVEYGAVCDGCGVDVEVEEDVAVFGELFDLCFDGVVEFFDVALLEAYA